MASVLSADGKKTSRLMHNHILYILTILALCIMFLSGCTNRKKDELESYRTQMETFFASLSSCSETINAIDANDESASSDLIAVIDEMAQHCADAAEITPPEEYANVQTMAGDARDLLLIAGEDFHKAFDGEYDEIAYSEGIAAYDSANTKIRGMVTLLHGGSE